MFSYWINTLFIFLEISKRGKNYGSVTDSLSFSPEPFKTKTTKKKSKRVQKKQPDVAKCHNSVKRILRLAEGF